MAGRRGGACYWSGCLEGFLIREVDRVKIR
jgi:hypothetical protein